jgi:putative polyhydroxyalkanoate system protein
MPKFNVNVPHSLSPQEARTRVERFADMLEKKFQNQVSELKQSWENDTLNFSFKTYGIPLQGGITVGESQLSCAGELPFSAMMFRGKIESAIREELERLVAA